MGFQYVPKSTFSNESATRRNGLKDTEFDNPKSLGENLGDLETGEEHLFLWPRKIAGSNEFLGDVIKD